MVELTVNLRFSWSFKVGLSIISVQIQTLGARPLAGITAKVQRSVIKEDHGHDQSISWAFGQSVMLYTNRPSQGGMMVALGA